MIFQINLYEIYKGVCSPLALENARARNAIGADIYWTPNNFEGHARKKTDLREITCFYCEIDEGTKDEQIATLKRHLPPSCVVETKRGHHVYWYLDKPIDCSSDPVGKADWFREIVKGRICPALNADVQAADACRLLRMPMYQYWKDGLGTFIVSIQYEFNRKYSLHELLQAFPERKILKLEPSAPAPLKSAVNAPGGDSAFWSKAHALDCRSSLERLSGSSHVSGERYTFKKEGPGRTRIVIDGKPRNVWLDRDGKIGSVADGGPGVPNWLFYYWKDWKAVADRLKQAFPELSEGKAG
jgi:hypothetical protein